MVQIFELKRVEGATALVYHTSEISWLKCISGEGDEHYEGTQLNLPCSHLNQNKTFLYSKND